MSEDAGSEAAKPPRQLHMVLPPAAFAQVPVPKVSPPLVLRTFVRGRDEAEHVRLMHGAGFTDWTVQRLDATFERMVTDGLYVVEDAAARRLVMTAMATLKTQELHPQGAELGWVAGDPAYAGRGLGLAACAAVAGHFIRHGYQRIYLQTDDWRLPAIKVYLRLGFQPFLYDPTMPGRWQAVCAKLGWPVERERWLEL